MPLIVEDKHFDYLKLQRGALDQLAHDRAVWHQAYEQSLEDDFESMAPHLPSDCRALLDVGSGLGGIDALLNGYYGGGVHVRLLDGLDDAAVMSSHAKTYNSMAVAADFLRKNGVDYLGCYSPSLGLAGAAPDGLTYDLVISLQSWCFHYPPADYLGVVKCRCHRGSVLIIDVRADKPFWREQLGAAFSEIACAKAARKFNRLVFHVA